MNKEDIKYKFKLGEISTFKLTSEKVMIFATRKAIVNGEYMAGYTIRRPNMDIEEVIEFELEKVPSWKKRNE